ncbi:aspartyl/glutamyl-tRNA amidotransferase subunit C [Mycoplasma corogypsi]|uniref:Asp-tRNA(Asn)/Glu-tRNA(Gln) amidotransferase subunit GatC n=1 Tax=Mycoplasma corogypsi TaxID=2106 RepID=UPI003872B3A3
MQKIDNNKLKEIVSSLMFEPTEIVINEILDNWHVLEKELKYLDLLDLEDVAPLTHINETLQYDFLREDKPNMSYSISKKDILANAKEKDENYIIVSKVVK